MILHKRLMVCASAVGLMAGMMPASAAPWVRGFVVGQYEYAFRYGGRADFARACLDLWDRRAPAGIYNVVNPGYVTTREVVTTIERVLKPARTFEFWADDAEFYRIAAKTPRSNCIMDTTKLLATGVKIRPVEEALETSLRNWQPEKTV